jgi:hypothetical protein
LESGLGTDIEGGVEMRPGGHGTPWTLTTLGLDELPRHYDAFGLLFGVRNYAGFLPVAPGRGMPADASLELHQLGCGSSSEHDHTWVTWTELAAIDWTAPAPTVDARIHEYKITSDGLVRVGKASSHGRAWHAVAGPDADPRGTAYPQGTQWQNGDRLWRVERLHGTDVLRADPQLRNLPTSSEGLTSVLVFGLCPGQHKPKPNRVRRCPRRSS